ncbi:transferrin receptor protein 1 [Gadus morhua]|uniref:Transferrin receptor protein 1 n=1 Tax=Gadus morhua TaxID=8049 RepID=A0A8C5B7K0_GADMO|nr:transferrin receptor protein 1-like [Gadus morhua]
MEQARTTISKIFNGEPRSYTRFNLTQNMEGDNSHVEMKLSADLDEEVGGNGVGETHQPNGVHGPYALRKTGRSPMNICFLVSATLLIFIIGYLIGYLVHRKKEEVALSCKLADLPLSPPSVVQRETGAAPLMDWADVKSLLAEQLSADKLEQAFRDLGSASHRAGSLGDEALANKVLSRFKAYSMHPWSDEHFVRVQEPDARKPNQVTFKGVTEKQTGFLSYSATGNVTGAILYAYYGRMDDFEMLKDFNMLLSGRVVLVKAGKISFADKVANAARWNVSAVLIYGDTDINELYGHVHLGSGDPYSPGFPSFNHTRFAAVQSSGLPSILAQTISWKLAERIIGSLEGHLPPNKWRDVIRLGDNDVVTVEVNNVLVEKKIHNILGVIKGLVDPDRYIILGAQRDAWGTGFAKSTVGTSVLVELARSISTMVKHGGFRPRRSIVFASWSAGDYGNVGSTEWLEGYLASLSMKAFSYISLDGVVTGSDKFNASASHLLQSLVKRTMKELSPIKERAKMQWQANLQPMQMSDAAFPFLAFSGIPSISFRFTGTSDYPYLDTPLDTKEQLSKATSYQVTKLALDAAQVAGQMTLRLVHDYLLSFDLQGYDQLITVYTADITRKVLMLQKEPSPMLPKEVTPEWLQGATGSFSRAMSDLMVFIRESELHDPEMCREINDRLMQVERNLLSPYVSPRDSPFRHIFIGSGQHTFKAIVDQLEAFRLQNSVVDVDTFKTELALATWTLQGCANSLAGDVWSLDNEI